MTGVSHIDDGSGGSAPLEPPAWALGDLPVSPPEPDWLERAFATGEWPAESALPARGGGAEVWAVPGVDAGRAGHPVLDAVAGVRRSLAATAAVGVSWLDARQTSEAVVGVHRVIAQASALAAVLSRHAETVDLPASDGSPSAAAWVARATRLTRRDAHRLARIGDALGDASGGGSGAGRYGAHLAPAFLSGAVNVEQADVIVKALDALPDDLDAAFGREAEAALVDLAADHDAKDLRVLGRRILSVVAPGVGEAHDAAALEKDERDAGAHARLTMAADGDGRVHGRFTLPELHGAMLRKALEAFAAPGHANAGDDPEARFRVDRLHPARMGEAFCELLETLDDRVLPEVGGTGATVVVTMTLDALRGGLAPAHLDTGDVLSAAEARRLACGAGLVPAVLGSTSEVLDLGRGRRLFSKAQRTAMALRDRGCIAEGCDRPPHQCHAHHLDPWAAGGSTDLDSGGLLCGHHHRRAHDPRYVVLRLGTGKLRFTRRT